MNYFRGRSSDRKVNTEAYLSSEDFIQDTSKILLYESNFMKDDVFIRFWKLNRMGVNDGNFIKSEVPLDERKGAFADRSVPNDTDVVYVSVNLRSFHLYLNTL
jgi:hypothetical protein